MKDNKANMIKKPSSIKDRIFYFFRETGGLTLVWKALFFLKLDSTQGGAKKTITEEKRKRAQVYFAEHEADIGTVVERLADKESAEIYLSMIAFRKTSDIKKHPAFRFEDQYFVENLVPHNEEEVFVDCGGFIGDTVSSFLKWSRGRFKRIVVLEPDHNSREQLKQYIKKKRVENRTTLLPVGAWDREETLHFQSAAEGSVVVSGGDTTIQGMPLDDIRECGDATFIKMDIEGAEQRALMGANNIILTNHPKLAICIYHSDEDMVEIPKMIIEQYPFYNIYIRQHSPWQQETVLYAIP